MVWLDQRRVRGEAPIGGVWGLLFRIAGVRETVANFQADAEANWLRRHQPAIWAATDKFLLLSGYLTHRLVGRYVDSVGCHFKSFFKTSNISQKYSLAFLSFYSITSVRFICIHY